MKLLIDGVTILFLVDGPMVCSLYMLESRLYLCLIMTPACKEIGGNEIQNK